MGRHEGRPSLTSLALKPFSRQVLETTWKGGACASSWSLANFQAVFGTLTGGAPVSHCGATKNCVGLNNQGAASDAPPGQ